MLGLVVSSSHVKLKCLSLCPRGLALFAGGAVLLVVVIAVVLVITLKDDNEDSGQAESNGTVVTTEFGKLRGAWVDGKQGRGFKYAAFRGIPYAQAPVGRLRFKGPRDPEKWDGIRDATQEGSTCYQKDSGSEDCLFLNVYTPALPTEKENPKRAVYVHVHGGGFITGSATAEYRGPDFLVQQDIVVVLMNYRLGFLGFMSLDTDVIPGNVALKDVVHSLQWIQRNIHNFGGDPSKVTLGGCSAGGVGAGWLSILPATQGLFRSAIVLSGTPVSGWGLNLRNIEYAKTIYKLLTGKDSDDRSEIGEMLMTVDVDELYKAVLRATDILHETKSLGSDISFFATPTLEEREDGVEKKLITRDAESYVINPERAAIPIILGETAREWIQIFTTTDLYNKTFLEDVIENSFISRVTNGVFPGKETRRLLNISEDKDVNKYVKEIRDYYFLRNVTENYDNTCKMADFLSHSYIMADTSHFARLRSKYCPEPTYFYVFNVKSDYNMDTSSFPPCMRDAVVHSDDEAYLWTAGFQDKLYYGDSRAARAVRRQVALLTNFVKEMDPTPRLDDDVITLRWRPIRHGEPETYLEINDDLVQRDGSPQGEDSQLWTKVYSELREGK